MSSKSKTKTLADMVEGQRIMVFSDIKGWSLLNKATKKHYEFQAMYRPENDSIDSVTKHAEGYRNFPNGFWQVFHENIHIGESKTFPEAMDIAKDYIYKKIDSGEL